MAKQEAAEERKLQRAAGSPRYSSNHRIGGMTGTEDFCEHAAGSDFEDALLVGIVHKASQSLQCVCDSENTTASRSAELMPAADASDDGTDRIGPVRFRSTCNS